MYFSISSYQRIFGARLVRLPASGSSRFKLAWAACILHIKNSILSFLHFLLYKKNDCPKRILIFRTGSLGDTICTTPGLAGIRHQFPEAHITLLTNAGSKKLVNPIHVISKELYNDVIDYLGIGPWPLYKQLRKGKFDLVIEIPQVDAGFTTLFRDLLYFRMVAKAGWGWKIAGVKIFKKTIEAHVVYRNESERILHLVNENGIVNTLNVFHLNITEEDERFADNFYSEYGITGSNSIIVAVGANSIKNRWPIEYFGQVINYFRVKYSVILIGGKDDADLVSQFRGMDAVYDTCGMFTPMQSAAVIKRAAIALCNDTGPLHLAYAVNTPVIGLFAARDFYGKWFPPQFVTHEIFRTADVPCSLCFFNPCSNNICMQAIHPVKVMEAMEKILSGPIR